MTEIAATYSGGCQCGRTRYRLSFQPIVSHLCHCRMCQKASGNLFAALTCVPGSALRWTRGTPATWRSSAHVERGFCSVCGTPLFYWDVRTEDVAIMVGSLDNPAQCPATSHHGTESRLAWVSEFASLPDHQATNLEERAAWAREIRDSNRQHPDFDTETEQR